jgi:hypothetical protein
LSLFRIDVVFCMARNYYQSNSSSWPCNSDALSKGGR